MKSFFINGIVIQDAREKGEYDDYLPLFRGVGCFPPWPLEEGMSQTIDEVIKRCEYYFFRWTAEDNLALWVIPELELIKSYILLCYDNNISVRALLCRTTDSYPVCQRGVELEAQSKPLGYDFASRSCDFSLLAMDIFDSGLEELISFKSCLNEYGLFSDYEALGKYILARKAMARQTKDILEADSESCEFKLYDCTDAILSMLGIDQY